MSIYHHLWLILLLIAAVLRRSEPQEIYSEEKVIRFLALVQWRDEFNRPHSGWDTGPDMLAAGRVAVQEINSRTDILTNYTLEMIEGRHEACGLTGATLGIKELASGGIGKEDVSVVAVLGLFCSTSTQHIAPVAGRAGLIQLSAANSPLFSRDLQKFPHLWRILVSARAYADMMLSLMRRIGWKKVGLVQDLNTLFHSGIAESFIDLIRANNEYSINYRAGIVRTREELIDTALGKIKKTGTRIVFLQTTGPQTAKFLCAAANKNMVYPDYLWIITDYFLTGLIGELEGLSNCNETLLRKGINGSLIGFFDLQDTEAIFTNASGFNYSEYQQKYLEQLNETRKEYYNSDDDVGDVLYAGLLYDQVWALALAINNAIELYNISMEDYSYNQYEVTNKIEESLSRVSFRGATGHIMFSEDREVSTPVNIYQVNSNASEPHILIGYYDSYHNTINITINNLPSDEINTDIKSVPLEVAIGLYVAVLSVTIIVTIILICLLYHRSKPPVKATSPFVSFLMFLGCYLFLVNDLLRITYASFPRALPDIIFKIFCNVSTPIFFNGCSFIFLTLLIKLMRVRKIFYNRRLSKYLSPFWSNKVIAMVVIMMTVFPNSVILSWMILDPREKEKIITNNTDGPLLYYEEVDKCKSSSLGYLFIVIFLYLFILFMVTIVTAALTRKIKHKDFKDTKKVNAFIYMYVLTLSFMGSSVGYFDSIDMPIVAHYFAIPLSLAIVCECIFILFLPKLISLLFNNKQSDVVNFL